MLRLLLLISLCLPLLASAQGQWKWRDAQGRIQFSDRPPPQGTPDKDVLARPANAPKPIQVVPFGQPAASAPAAAPAASSPQERVAANEKAKRSAEADAKQKANEQRDQQARAENCKNARTQISTLESGVRIASVNDKGERVVLDDAQRAAEIAKLKTVIASECR